jgi:hypothetical protein
MGYAWSSRSRLTPMRMVECDHSYPKYDVIKYRRPRLRRMTRLGWHVSTKLETCHQASEYPAGRLGEWPVFKYGKRKAS